MADIEKWLDSNSLYIKWGKANGQEISVRRAIMYDEQRCEHCFKIIKKGKQVFCPAINPLDFFYTMSGWGKMDSIDGWRNKPTFCSANHAKIFAKSNNGL